jgi:hypothetical protein
VFQDAAIGESGRLSLRGDLDLLVFTFCELRRSYSELPARWLGGLVLRMKARGLLQAGGPAQQRTSLEDEALAACPLLQAH